MEFDGQPTMIEYSIANLFEYYCNSNTASLSAVGKLALDIAYFENSISVSGQLTNLQLRMPLNYSTLIIPSINCRFGLSCSYESDLFTLSVTYLNNFPNSQLTGDLSSPIYFQMPQMAYATRWAIVDSTRTQKQQPPNNENTSPNFLTFIEIPFSPNDYTYNISFIASNPLKTNTFTCSGVAQSFIPSFLFDFEFSFSTDGYTLQVTEVFPSRQQPGNVQVNIGPIKSFTYGVAQFYQMQGDGWNSAFTFLIDVLSAP